MVVLIAQDLTPIFSMSMDQRLIPHPLPLSKGRGVLLAFVGVITNKG
jgi:hypothetical protein